jgi:stage V sporulation protein K
MEDYRNQFIAIIAGYEQEMQWFLSTNPGLPSRFPIHLTFPDYETKSLMEIAKRSAASRQYKLSPQAELKIRRRLQRILQNPLQYPNFSNARFVRNTMEHAIRLHATRLFDSKDLTRDCLMTLEAVDFEWEETP